MPAPSVPLSHYLTTHPGVGLRFTCDGCQASHDVSMEVVLDRLKHRGLGDERTGVREVAKLATRPCARCGAMAWGSRPAFSVGR